MALSIDDDNDDINLYEVFTKTNTEEKRYDVCHCIPDGTIMENINNELICPKCKSIISNNVINMDDNFNVIIKVSQKEEHNFDKYWKPIVGEEEDWYITKLSDDEQARIKDYLNTLGYVDNYIQKISPERFREILKNDLNMKTEVVTHTTKIMIHYGYKLPYTPTKEDKDIIFRKFYEFMNLYEQENATNTERSNNMAKLFYIYKIIQTFFPETHRINLLLPFIKLNQKSTLKNNDLIWKKLCEKNNIIYKPL